MCKSWLKEQAHNLKWPALLYWCQARQNFRKAGHWGRLRNQRILTKTKRIFSMKSLNLARRLVTKRIHPKLRVICIVLICCWWVLSPQQIKLYFSRSAAKIKQAESVAKIDLSAINEEMVYSSARDKIIQECQLIHPILYDTYNLCQLYATNKLTRFSISFLQDICTYCHLEIDSIPATRKAPYIGLINDLIKSFTCNEKQKISSQEWP